MKNMRTALWLSIAVFISTLFWSQLLDKQQLTITFASCLLLLVPRVRILAVIPVTVLYFSLYVNLTLTGQMFPWSTIANKNALQLAVDGQNHNIVVRINSLISVNNAGYFKANLIELDGDHLNYSPTVEMRWYKPETTLQAGQLHRFLGRFKPVYGRANPGGFDRQKWSYSEHVAYQVTIKKHLSQIEGDISFRAYFYEKVKMVTDSLAHQGLILALAFADKSLIPYEIKKTVRNLGVSHLFAISGLHIGLFFSCVYIIVQFFVNRLLSASKMGWCSFRLVNVLALFGALGYAYLAGFTLPTQRAFLMLLVAVFIFSLKRKTNKADLLLVVLFVVLLCDPLAILSISLWLSFTAVAIILLLLWSFPNINNRKVSEASVLNKALKYFKLLFFLQVGLTILMLPIQLVSFSGLSLGSILANLIAVPLFSLVIIPMVLLASLITLFLPQLALLIFTVSDQLFSLFFSITAFLNESYQFYSLVNEQRLIVFFLLVVIVFIFHFHAINNRLNSYLFTMVLLLLFAIDRFYSPTPKDEWFIETIDVGQGLAVLVRTSENALLYDTGARYASGFNMVDSEIMPYLRSIGIKKLDHLVISHSDNDHAGGAELINTHMAIGMRHAGEPLVSKYNFKQCKTGQKWRLGELNIEVLSPDTIGKNDNNNSCVLRINDDYHSLLLTGDIEIRQEKIIMRQHSEKLNSDILFAPHHGSRHSSSEAFIKAVNPEWGVFSAGFMNHWGFPAKEVVKRYEKQSVNLVNSGLSGFIRFQMTPQNIKMKTFREDLAPYWYHRSLISSPLDWTYR